MSNNPNSFRERLIESQEFTPALRTAYESELDAIFHEAPSRKNRFLAFVLLAHHAGDCGRRGPRIDRLQAAALRSTSAP